MRPSRLQEQQEEEECKEKMVIQGPREQWRHHDRCHASLSPDASASRLTWQPIAEARSHQHGQQQRVVTAQVTAGAGERAGALAADDASAAARGGGGRASGSDAGTGSRSHGGTR